MIKEMKLKEFSTVYGISRRAIQGYENIGLVSPTREGFRGHLYYGDQAIKRIVLIKFMQDLGFSLKEIKAIIDSPKEELVSALLDKSELNHQKLNEMSSNISKTNQIIKVLNSKGKDTEAIYKIITGGNK